MGKVIIVSLRRWLNVKTNYLACLMVISIILLRHPSLNLLYNLTGNLFKPNDDLMIKMLQKENAYLKAEYHALIDFKSAIRLPNEYIITNVVKDYYGLKGLMVNGSDYVLGSEVINQDGLVGIVTKLYAKQALVDYLYNTNLVIIIGEETGKITGQDDNQNLIIKEVSNYNTIYLNDLVYSVNGTYIGKVIKIKYETIDNYLTVRPIDLKHLDYVAVIKW